jgi:hypothetical protein
MDLTASIAPKSDQINADDLISGPRTFTVESVTEGSTEQPFNIHLVENPGRPYRPSKSMRRVLVMAWGKESDDWPTGGRITLFRDPEVKFGRDEVGGIKISHLSHIDRPMTFALTEKRGSRKPHTVEPLPDAGPPTATADHLGAIKAHMGRVGMSPGDLLKLASTQVGRVVGHPGELAVTEADELIAHLTTLPAAAPDDANYAADVPDGNADD